MKEDKKSPWIEAGYQMVALEGFNSLQVESIARSLQKNKSSFYHYFGDLELFEESLLAHHVSSSVLFAEKLQQCQNLRPEALKVFLEHKTHILFHKQLRINRAQLKYQKCFQKAFDHSEAAILDTWSEFLGLSEQKMFARTFLQLIAENFLLQVTEQNFNAQWLNEYVNEISAVLTQMHASGKSAG